MGSAWLSSAVDAAAPLPWVPRTSTHMEAMCLWCPSLCDIPWYRAFPRNPFIINISMYFGATEKWHVQMVMVSRVVQLAGALDAPSGTRVSNRPVYAVISVKPDV